MSDNRFLVAGWAAIAAAGLMPAAFIVAGFEEAAFDSTTGRESIFAWIDDKSALDLEIVARHRKPLGDFRRKTAFDFDSPKAIRPQCDDEIDLGTG